MACAPQYALSTPVQACLPLARYNLSRTAVEELLALLKKKKETPLVRLCDEAKRLEMTLSQPRCRFYMREFQSFRSSIPCTRSPSGTGLCRI